MSTRTRIIELVNKIEDEQFLKVLLAMVSEYQNLNNRKPENYFKPYTQEEYEDHLRNVLHDMDMSGTYTQQEVEKEIKTWSNKK